VLTRMGGDGSRAARYTSSRTQVRPAARIWSTDTMAPLLRHRHSERTFESLYRAHAGDVYRYALAVTGNRSDAEDVAQTTFMNAYRALERGERPVKPQNWLIAIAHNVCRQRFRQAARRPTEVVFAEDVAEALVPSDDTPTATDIQRALGHLALNQREALVMRELEGRSYAEIAELLGTSVSAVETLIFRARRALREQLDGSLTCAQAEAALSLQLDGRLPRGEAGQLRAHLRQCEECRHLARRQRAQRKGFKAFAALPLPPSLLSAFSHGGGAAAAGGLAGGGSATVTTASFGGGAGATTTAATATTGGLLGGGLAVKAAAVTVAAVVAGGGGYAVVRHETAAPSHTPTPAGKTTQAPAAGSSASQTSGKALTSGNKGGARRSTPGASPAHGGAALGQPAHPTHPAHPAHPAHSSAAEKPTHPAKPAHPVQAAHPATPQPTHPAKPVKPAQKPLKPAQSLVKKPTKKLAKKKPAVKKKARHHARPVTSPKVCGAAGTVTTGTSGACAQTGHGTNAHGKP
jgi:RNA polymerase sigma factor (sigma-70 family)